MLEATVPVRRDQHALATELVRRIEGSRQFPATIDMQIEGDAAAWLERQADDFKLIWANRGEAHSVIGMGIAQQLVAMPNESASDLIGRCRRTMSGLPGLRMYGGFAFASDRIAKDTVWRSFGPASFWLPRVTWCADRLRVVVLNPQDRESAIRFASKLGDLGSSERTGRWPGWIGRVDQPDRARWERCIAATLQMFREEVLEKIVLARQVELELDAPLNPVALLRRLAPVTPGCYHFCLQTSAHVGFVGATPERLFWRRGRELASEVVAGTRPRGQDARDDQRLADELLASRKDQLEHDIVRKSIRQRLHGYVDRLEVDPHVSLLKLATKQHLFSRVTARLHAEVDDGALIDRLHPTPAVGGYPTENALDEIQRLEGFERGWYAAPVGWIAEDEAEFAVAIRSGLVQTNRLILYSGAGIVPASTAELEWYEIENKISDFLQLFVPARVSADAASR